MTGQDAAGRPLGAGYVVIAEFEVIPEQLSKFMALAQAFSDECIENEAGCWQFDVVQLETTSFGVLFYEVYDDLSAFDAHCRSEHLTRFKAAFKQLVVAERPLRRGSRGHATA
jgi:quinol monooxygenase YgiN